MKSNSHVITAIACISSLTGCIKDRSINDEIPSGKTITITAQYDNPEPDTKMSISGDKTNGFSTAWELGDRIGVFTDYSGSSTTLRTDKTFNNAISIASGGITSDGKAKFTGSLYSGTQSSANSILYCYFPYHYNADNTNDGTRTFQNVSCNLPVSQKMSSSGSFDNSAAYMVGMATRVDLSGSKSISSTGIKFRHIFSFINIKLKSNTCLAIDDAAEKIISVKLKVAGKTLAGDFALDLSTGNTIFETRSDSVMVEYSNQSTSLKDMSAWLIVNPFTLNSTDRLDVEIITDKHIITKTITDKSKDFKAKGLYPITISLDESTCIINKCSNEWELITDASQITDGTYVITHCISSTGTYYYMPNTTATSVGPTAQTGITVTNGKLSNTVTDDMKWLIRKNGSGYNITSWADNSLTLGAKNSNDGIRVASAPLFVDWHLVNDSRATSAIAMSIATSSTITRYAFVYNAKQWYCSSLLTSASNLGYMYLFKKKEIVTADTPAYTISVPFQTNTYLTQLDTTAQISTYFHYYVINDGSDANAGKMISDEAWLSSYIATPHQLSFYFRTEYTGVLELGLVGYIKSGSAVLDVEVEGVKHRITVSNTSAGTIDAGRYIISKKGYVRVNIIPISATSTYLPYITDFMLGGSAINYTTKKSDGAITFVTADETTAAGGGYFIRRGAAPNLGWTQPKGDTEYFYNEIIVPEGQDAPGAYFMTTGGSAFYMGIQPNTKGVNRDVLFSVWDTDTANGIKAKLVRHGDGITVNDFGNEGSGIQTIFFYDWVPGTKYATLIRVHPEVKNGVQTGHTLYAGYFWSAATGWKLLAEIRRPNVVSYYTGAHSFLENFLPEQGFLIRQVTFTNQWMRTSDGVWHEITNAIVGVDGTGGLGIRLDFFGGVDANGNFYLKSDGYFDETIKPYSQISRTASGQSAPVIDFAALEAMGIADE